MASNDQPDVLLAAIQAYDINGIRYIISEGVLYTLVNYGKLTKVTKK